jgi:hypothetical protein
MAVKIFCSACQQFIKDATRVEIRTVTGEEICSDCEKGVKNAFDEVEKSARRAIVQIETVRDQAKANLERLYKKVIKPDE